MSTPDFASDFDINSFSVGPNPSAPWKNLSVIVGGKANPPGTSLSSSIPYLDSSEVGVNNTSSTTHHIQIVFTAETFDLPAATSVQIVTKLNSDDFTGMDLSQASTLTASTTGGLIFSRQVALQSGDSANVTSAPIALSGDYSMTETYDLWLKAGGTVKGQMVMNVVAAAPEPPAIGLAIVALGGLFSGRRLLRRSSSGSNL
ncbi:MAG TPA: hypothetical protein VMJ32_17180 [Pirellulales bacterium]|nr:hypothetical protein [Pirellulales bacterium]